jgi:two-component system chemotaxis response regulator CheY
LVGHCGADTSYLRMTVKSALGESVFVSVEDNESLQKALADGPDLVLLNRELGFGFEPDMGVGMIRQLHAAYPNVRFMLISNHRDAQLDAQAAGALPGFGKREIGTPRVAQLLRDAVAADVKQ